MHQRQTGPGTVGQRLRLPFFAVPKLSRFDQQGDIPVHSLKGVADYSPPWQADLAQDGMQKVRASRRLHSDLASQPD
jgi:hypothetical protein